MIDDMNSGDFATRRTATRDDSRFAQNVIFNRGIKFH
jgi:hypothetical protein